MKNLELEIKIRSDGHVSILTLSGPVDSATFDRFQDTLGPFCLIPGAKVLLDCSKLTYLNSRSIGLLMRHHRGLQISHGRLALAHVNQKLVRTLDLLQIGKSLAIYPSVEEALAALK